MLPPFTGMMFRCVIMLKKYSSVCALGLVITLNQIQCLLPDDSLQLPDQIRTYLHANSLLSERNDYDKANTDYKRR